MSIHLRSAAGKWAVEQLKENKVPGDQGLVLKSRAKHHAIAAMMNKPFVFQDEPLVIQWVQTCTHSTVHLCGCCWLSPWATVVSWHINEWLKSVICIIQLTKPREIMWLRLVCSVVQVWGEFPGRYRLWWSVHQTAFGHCRSQSGWYTCCHSTLLNSMCSFHVHSRISLVNSTVHKLSLLETKSKTFRAFLLLLWLVYVVKLGKGCLCRWTRQHTSSGS